MADFKGARAKRRTNHKNNDRLRKAAGRLTDKSKMIDHDWLLAGQLSSQS